VLGAQINRFGGVCVCCILYAKPRNSYTLEFAESQAGVSVCVGGKNRFDRVRVCCMLYVKPRSSYMLEHAESQAGMSKSELVFHRWTECFSVILTSSLVSFACRVWCTTGCAISHFTR